MLMAAQFPFQTFTTGQLLRECQPSSVNALTGTPAFPRMTSALFVAIVHTHWKVGFPCLARGLLASCAAAAPVRDRAADIFVQSWLRYLGMTAAHMYTS
mmetsp:Transcript_146842/g.259532  ORF Transcript_146842/g.259532 Transcript_146842/m.259532 type:complete len:99 (+) Transcript_146842:31-327(+)